MTTTHPSGYRPISCDVHDLLEVLATTRRRVRVRFRDDEGALQDRNATVADVFSRNGVEYISLDTGETLRLDRLVEAGDAKLADY